MPRRKFKTKRARANHVLLYFPENDDMGALLVGTDDASVQVDNTDLLKVI